MSYDSSNLTTPDIKWLGVRPTDLDRYRIPPECRLPMTDSDIKTGKDLLQADFITKNPEWVKELELMIKTKEKAEIQVLLVHSLYYSDCLTRHKFTCSSACSTDSVLL